MKVQFYIAFISLFFCFSRTYANSDLDIVVSIKPFHSLVAGVMDGVAMPRLLLKGNFSPHRYSMKPSDAEELQHADIIFWGGENLELFLAKPLRSLSKKANVVSVLQIDGLTFKSFRSKSYARKSEIFEYYTDNLLNDNYIEQQSLVDPHIWLDPENAKVITNEIVDILCEFDPDNAKKYQMNGENINVKLNALDHKISSEMKEIFDRKYLVLHDAYQYFESRYQLKNAGSITLNMDHFLSVKRLKKVQKMIKKNEVLCVFGEPQYSQKIIDVLIVGTSVKKGILDPIGADLLPGPELYFNLMKNMSNSLKSCLN